MAGTHGHQAAVPIVTVAIEKPSCQLCGVRPSVVVPKARRVATQDSGLKTQDSAARAYECRIRVRAVGFSGCLVHDARGAAVPVGAHPLQ